MRMIKWFGRQIASPAFDAQMERIQDVQDRAVLEQRHADELQSIYRDLLAARDVLDESKPAVVQ